MLFFLTILPLILNMFAAVGDSFNENKVCRCMQLNLPGDKTSTYYYKPIAK